MNYHNITYPDMNNGSGLRVVLWLSGCSHHCYNCQNTQTWNPNSGILFDKKAEEELFRELSKDYISGLTLTGGDPLHENNLNEVLRLTEKIRVSFPDKTIWLYSGYTFNKIESEVNKFVIGGLCANDYDYFDALHDIEVWRIRHEILSLCDVFVDGKYIDTQRDITLKWRGSENQRVIDIKKVSQGGRNSIMDRIKLERKIHNE